MTKFTIYLAAVALAAVLEIGLSSTIGHYRNWDQFSGHQVGFATGKCSALSGLLPDPKSGCCGRHAGADNNNGDDEENGTDDGNNETGGGDEDNDSGLGDDTDDGNNEIGGGDEDTDSGLGDDTDDGNNDIGDGDEDADNDDGGNDDYEEGDGNGDSWIDDIGDIFDDIGSIKDDIFDYMGLADEHNSGPTKFSAKSVVEQNASDIAPDGYITGGKPAGLREHPWLVHLHMKVRQFMSITTIGCGGSLISPRFVLTAAHCVDHEISSYNDISVFLAEYNTNTYPTDCVGKTCIKNVVMHPDKVIKHKQFESSKLANDIALMRLKGSAPYTEYIRPICLPSFNIDNPKNQGAPLAITGWGSTGRKPSPIKLTAEVQLVPHKQCKRHYYDLTSSHICAASDNGQDTCQGDSGGPIVAEYEGNHYVVGIVSGKAGTTSCGSSVPTLYTNVFVHSKWIQENMRV